VPDDKGIPDGGPRTETRYRDGWDCDGLTDEEVILNCVEHGDMSREIDGLAEMIRVSFSFINLLSAQED